MPQTAIKIGPTDHGRRMTLDEFDHAEVLAGYLYELGRGVVVVSDIPKRRHLGQVYALRRQLHAHDLSHPGEVYLIAAGSECKIMVRGLESERHPDIAVYLTPPPEDEDETWFSWIPALVIEVVSPGSEQRDYHEKREEYFQFGVQEYWIVDADKEEVLVLRRVGGRWKEKTVRAPDVYRSTVLRGFELNVAQVFDAAK